MNETTKQIIAQFHKLLRAVGPDGDQADAVRAALKMMEKVVELEELDEWIQDQKPGLPPPATHSIQARMRDEKFAPPRAVVLTDTDVKKAIWKSRKTIGPAETSDADLIYMTALEDDNAALLRENGVLQKSLDEVNETEVPLWTYDDKERVLGLENAALLAYQVLHKGMEIITELVSGLSFATPPFRNHEKLEEVLVLMAKTRRVLDEALSVGRKSGATPDKGQDDDSG